jgi:leucyl/phenylalanyl-tRNA---protein transferase
MDTFGARELLSCYANGVFPMADSREDERLFLIDPEHRGVLPLGGFHISRRLARTVRSDLYEVRVDTAFAEVVAACAAPREGHKDTWINAGIERLYGELHEMGYAHSVECWKDGALVGGLYGVSLRGAFFGESMFSRARDASKVALVHLVARLIAGGYSLLDAQFLTEHLAQFGAVEIPRRDYRRRLKRALATDGDFYAYNGGSAGAAGAGVGFGAGGGTIGLGAGAAAGAGAGLAAGAADATAAGLAAGGAALVGAFVAGAEAGTSAGAVALQVITQAS